MKKVIALIMIIIFCASFCACTKEKYDPEMIVRNTCFDEYYTFGEVHEGFKGRLFGYVVGMVAKDSFIFTSEDNGKYLWEENWYINEDIPWFESIVAVYPFDAEKEDLLCVTLSENIDSTDIAEEEGDSTYSLVCSIDKTTKTAVPQIYFSTEDGILKNEMSVNSENAICNFYVMSKYMISDVEYIRENVYGLYN